MRTFIAAKIHGVTVTACHLNYHGSQSLPASLMQAVGIQPYEQVHVVNLKNGRRWITYALTGPEGVCTLKRRGGPQWRAGGRVDRHGLPPGRAVHRGEGRVRHPR